MKIEDLSDKRQIKEALIKGNAEFNMESIFMEEKYEGAMILITPNQTLKEYISISHEDVAKKMYEAMYGEELKNDKNKMWQQVLADEDIICIQICRDGYQIIFLPKEISTKQYNMMKETTEEFNKIERRLGKEEKYSLDYMLAINKENGEVEDGKLSLEEIMKKASEITKTNKLNSKRKEEILGINQNGIGSFARSARRCRKYGIDMLREVAKRNKSEKIER